VPALYTHCTPGICLMPALQLLTHAMMCCGTGSKRPAQQQLQHVLIQGVCGLYLAVGLIKFTQANMYCTDADAAASRLSCRCGWTCQSTWRSTRWPS
jgi:hypothetical protein